MTDLAATQVGDTILIENDDGSAVAFEERKVTKANKLWVWCGNQVFKRAGGKPYHKGKLQAKRAYALEPGTQDALATARAARQSEREARAAENKQKAKECEEAKRRNKVTRDMKLSLANDVLRARQHRIQEARAGIPEIAQAVVQANNRLALVIVTPDNLDLVEEFLADYEAIRSARQLRD